MRRESSTVVVLAGDVGEGLLADLGRSGNVSVVRAPAAVARQAGGPEPTAPRPGWEAGALAMREAARRQSAYVIVPEDPLADVAAAWRAMWDVTGGPGGAAQAGRALEALRSLEHGPWWPPLNELVDVARYFYAGGLTETQPSPARPASRTTQTGRVQ